MAAVDANNPAKTEPELVLFSWGSAHELASFDPFCLTVQTYMRFLHVEFAVNNTNDPRTSPTGELPVLCIKDEVAAGSSQVINLLRSKGYNADSTLSSKQKADSKAFCSIVEDKLHDALLYSWWINKDNYNKAVQPMYAKAIPFPWNYILPAQLKSNVEWKLRQHAHQSNDSLLTDEPVFIMARNCYRALSAKLGTQPYFFGESPSTLDAVVYGHLAVQYYAPLPNHKLRTSISAFPNLVAFLQRVQQTYFSEWTPIPTSAPPSPRKSPKKSPRKASSRSSEQPVAEESSIIPISLNSEQQQLLISCAVALASIAGFIYLKNFRSEA